MTNRGHLISCLSYEAYKTFITEGYAGLFPIPIADEKFPKPSKSSMGAKIGTNWDVIADIKRVKPDDYIFLHTEGTIYGPFLADSHFKEDPKMSRQFQSRNLKIDFWQSHYSQSYKGSKKCPLRVSIKSIPGVTREKGIPLMELFKRISLGDILSIPQRFKYHDKPKIVKPLLNSEVRVLNDLFLALSASNFLTVKPMNLTSFNSIELNLDSYSGELYREKILEAWLMENATDNGNNGIEYTNVGDILGTPHHFVNSIFTYYTNFIDVLFYDDIEYPVSETCHSCKKFTSQNKIALKVIELKKGAVTDDNIPQLREYYDWTVRTLANNQANRVEMFFIGNGFSNTLLKQSTIKCIKYTLHNSNPRLRLQLLN